MNKNRNKIKQDETRNKTKKREEKKIVDFFLCKTKIE